LKKAGWHPYEEGEAVVIGDTGRLVRWVDVDTLDGVCKTSAVDI
jgi:hypothetical protein